MNPPDFARAFDALHFLRPWWLCALLALPVLAWGSRARRRRNPWRGVVDAHLLPHLLVSAGTRRGRFALAVAALGYALAVVALAGPSWRQSAQPLWQPRRPLMIALDLSSTTLAPDLPPSRLAHARAKLAALLREREGGPVGLVAFADDAFTVAPLTDDAANVELFLDALQPDVMPVDGQRADRAIAWSAQLLERGGAAGGDIVLLTDHAGRAAMAAAAEAAGAGHRVSVLGLGSAGGAAYHRPDGTLATARLDAASLRALAARGHGRYAALAADDADLRALGLLEPDPAAAVATHEGARAWKDEGYWLLPLLMVLALFAFRRRGGVLAVLLLGVAPLHPARAAELWRRPDQAAHAQLERGNAAYRAGDFAAAARLYEDLDSATAHYNRGNALARAGRYPQAIAAYDQALRRQPGMTDALANKRAVEDALRRRPPPESPSPRQSRPSPQSGQSQQDRHPQAGPEGQARRGGGTGQSYPGTLPAPASPQRAPAPRAPSPPPAEATDAQAQQAADRAQRERMQRALRAQAGAEPTDPVAAPPEETPEQREHRLANEAWLKRVPDDPGELLRSRFRLEHERRQARSQP